MSVGVDLGRRQLAMPQELFDRCDDRPVRYHAGGHGMPERVESGRQI